MAPGPLFLAVSSAVRAGISAGSVCRPRSVRPGASRVCLSRWQPATSRPGSRSQPAGPTGTSGVSLPVHLRLRLRLLRTSKTRAGACLAGCLGSVTCERECGSRLSTKTVPVTTSDHQRRSGISQSDVLATKRAEDSRCPPPPTVSCDAAASAAGGARRGADAEQRDGEGRTAGGRARAECAGEAGAASGWGTPAPDSGSVPSSESSERRVHSRPAGGPRRVGLG